MLYLPPHLDGRPEQTGDALLVFTVVRGRVSIKLEGADDGSGEERDGGASTTVFSAGQGSVWMAPPSCTYSISNKFGDGAQLSFLRTPEAVADVDTGEHRPVGVVRMEAPTPKRTPAT
jgi:hypothetical protein